MDMMNTFSGTSVNAYHTICDTPSRMGYYRALEVVKEEKKLGCEAVLDSITIFPWNGSVDVRQSGK
jgi:hypothetical protein